MKSEIKTIGTVSFPQFTGERVYMLPFFQRDGLPINLVRYQPTINGMLKGIWTDQPIYLMIDEREVKQGEAMRRPGLHIDGNWIDSARCHQSEDGHETPEPTLHKVPSRWKNPEPTPITPRPRPKKPKDLGLYEEAILLASTHYGCDALVGEYDCDWGHGGQVENLNPIDLQRIALAPNKAYAGNVLMIHESVPLLESGRRQLVRLNIPHLELSQIE